MAVNKGEIGIYGVLRRDGGDNVLANTDQIKDKQLNKTQEQLNQEAINNIDSKVDKVEGKSLVSDADITKLSELPNNDDLNNKLEAKLDKSSIESTITADSNNPVSSAAINTYIDNTVTTIEYNVTNGTWIPVRKGDGDNSVVVGRGSANGNGSFAEGISTKANGIYSHAEGKLAWADGFGSHAEGYNTQAVGDYSHAEGYYNYADGDFLNVVGIGNTQQSEGKNAFVIYATRTTNNEPDLTNRKTGYLYLINVGGYTGKRINTAKSVQEVIADLNTNLTNKVDKVEGKQLSTNDYTTAEKTKLAGLKTQNELNISISDAKKSGTDAQTTINNHIKDTNNPHNVTKDQVGLSNVDNTADINKEVKTATQLKTTRNIWGKAFNGSADIEGDINKVTEIYLTDGTKYAEPCTEEEINALFV